MLWGVPHRKPHRPQALHDAFVRQHYGRNRSWGRGRCSRVAAAAAAAVGLRGRLLGHLQRERQRHGHLVVHRPVAPRDPRPKTLPGERPAAAERLSRATQPEVIRAI